MEEWLPEDHPARFIVVKRREDRPSAMAAAKAKIEARVKERFEREQAAYEAKVAQRDAWSAWRGI